MSTDARSAILDREIVPYTRHGFRVVTRTETTAQLVKPKPFGCLPALLWFLLFGVGIIVYLIYYAAKSDRTAYLTVNENGVVHATGLGVRRPLTGQQPLHESTAARVVAEGSRVVWKFIEEYAHRAWAAARRTWRAHPRETLIAALAVGIILLAIVAIPITHAVQASRVSMDQRAERATRVFLAKHYVKDVWYASVQDVSVDDGVVLVTTGIDSDAPPTDVPATICIKVSGFIYFDHTATTSYKMDEIRVLANDGTTLVDRRTYAGTCTDR